MAWAKRLRGSPREGVDEDGNATVGAFKWRISLDVKSAEDVPDTDTATVVFVWSRGNKTCMSKPTDVDELSRCVRPRARRAPPRLRGARTGRPAAG